MQGLVECTNHGLLHAYPVLYEKSGELVAQAKATVLLLPNGSDRITVTPGHLLHTEKQVSAFGCELWLLLMLHVPPASICSSALGWPGCCLPCLSHAPVCASCPLWHLLLQIEDEEVKKVLATSTKYKKKAKKNNKKKAAAVAAASAADEDESVQTTS